MAKVYTDSEDFLILPSISVDCVIFGYSENNLSVLVRNEFVPLGNTIHKEWKFPGNHVRRNEDIYQTAARILKEQTGLDGIYVKQFQVFSSLDRLNKRPQDYDWVKPRLLDNRVITVGFYSLVNIDSIKNEELLEVAKWMNVYEVDQLMFDHNEIFDTAFNKLRYDLLHEPLVFELLPDKFTLTELQKIYETIFNTTYDKRNYRRKINKMPYLVPTTEIQTGVSHKPARFYTFDRELYENNKTERFDFRV